MTGYQAYAQTAGQELPACGFQRLLLSSCAPVTLHCVPYCCRQPPASALVRGRTTTPGRFHTFVFIVRVVFPW